MSSENSSPEGFHEAKREAIAEQVDPIFKGGAIWKRPIFGIFFIWLVMTVIGVLLGLLTPIHLMDGINSSDADSAKLTIVVFTVAAAPVSAIVYGIALYSLLVWRKRGASNDEPPADGPPIRGHGPATAIWLGVSVLLVVFLLFWGMAVLSSSGTSQIGQIRVKVIGQQWLWSFQYGGTKVETHNLVLPINRQVYFDVTSKDVTHGFWPVQLGVQVDANPGFQTSAVTTPNKLGRFDVRCSQLCGLNHAYMQVTGEVVTEQEFQKWLAAHGASEKSVATYTAIAK